MSNVGKWNAAYANARVSAPYGETTTYTKGAEWLWGCQTIQDWGCGLGYFHTCLQHQRYVGLDGSSSDFVDHVVDLTIYRSDVQGIFMRHVLEHNLEWRKILENAVASFTRRMCLVVFTPFAEKTGVIVTAEFTPGVCIPDISFSRQELTSYFNKFLIGEETLKTRTQYGIEHVFYLEKP